jgi:hypothetical protein
VGLFSGILTSRLTTFDCDPVSGHSEVSIKKAVQPPCLMISNLHSEQVSMSSKWLTVWLEESESAAVGDTGLKPVMWVYM